MASSKNLGVRRVSGPRYHDHIAILELQPRTASGQWPAKATVGIPVEVSATLVKDGHDVLAAALRWRVDGGSWRWAPMVDHGSGHVVGWFTPGECGGHEVQVVAWTDRFAGWVRDLVKRADAGQDLAVEFDIGAELLERLLAERAQRPEPEDQLPNDAASVAPSVDGGPRDHALLARVQDRIETLRRSTCSATVRLEAALDPEVRAALVGVVAPWDQTRSEKLAVWAEGPRAGFSAWYELFPRSHGGLRGVIGELDRVAAMGFDVLYLPPIHPIGRAHRKGPGNTLQAAPEDPGSPWAIGAAEGGHTAVHPELGTEDDLVALIGASAQRGIDVALDYALQCSPDHPWVAAHPEWFNRLADGTIRYAENPPKKYQDIYPINFWPDRDEDRAALWQACLDVLEHWVALGIRIFRVDNPHTKPVAFWAWIIGRLRQRHPDVVLLAEAFTAPAMMNLLGEVGFSQSYTYYTWRGTRAELTGYLTELSGAPTRNQMRPNFWPNTPDILEGVLRNGPLSAFGLRAVLAATLVPNYGIYSGYELGENQPQSPDNTEYLHSEKYQVVRRDFSIEPNLVGLISTVNAWRRAHPALQRMEGLHFHSSDNEALIVYSRRWGDDVVLCVVNLDPRQAQAATLQLDLAALGLQPDAPFQAEDCLSGQIFHWRGASPWVRLDPGEHPAHLCHIQPAG
ncbi:MAG: maltotransferase domain-containing protein [Acidimicrobiales bacterium]